MDNNINKEKLFELVKGGNNPQNVNKLVSSLSDSDKETLNKLLKDKKAREELLNSPEVKQFLNTFFTKREGK